MALIRLPLRLSFLVLILAASTIAFAADVASMSVAGGQLSWSPASAGYESIELTVSAPDGQIYTKRFSAQQSPSFSLSDLAGI